MLSAPGLRRSCYNRPVTSIGQVLGDAWLLYRILWRRSVSVALGAFAIFLVAELLASRGSGTGSRFAVLLLEIVVVAFVQGMLVESVRNVHEGRPQASLGDLRRRAGQLFPWLALGSVLYALVSAVGFLLLVLPGLFVFARWSLFPAVLVLEGGTVGDALRRSNEIVKGSTGKVLAAIVVTAIGIGLVGIAILAVLGYVGLVWQALAVPYEAHLLAAIYYRLTDPQRPVVHPAALTSRG